MISFSFRNTDSQSLKALHLLNVPAKNLEYLHTVTPEPTNTISPGVNAEELTRFS